LPPLGGEPFVRDFAEIYGAADEIDTSTAPDNAGNFSGFIWEPLSPSIDSCTDFSPCFIVPDAMHIWLFQEIVQTGGSVAFVLQSMITVLSSMAYYDQLLQFDNNQTVQVDYFVTANAIRHHRGLLAVCVALCVHLALVIAVTFLFARESRLSMLGNIWQAISQAVTGETNRYIAVSSIMLDIKVEEKMEEDGVSTEIMGLDETNGLYSVVRRNRQHVPH
jgi:hypothetical protein